LGPTPYVEASSYFFGVSRARKEASECLHGGPAPFSGPRGSHHPRPPVCDFGSLPLALEPRYSGQRPWRIDAYARSGSGLAEELLGEIHHVIRAAVDDPDTAFELKAANCLSGLLFVVELGLTKAP
jgi:hypothetical protein